VSGVCAGIARHFDINPNWVRGATAIAFVMAPFAVALAYVLAVLLLKTR
jgi:phage shock protein C